MTLWPSHTAVPSRGRIRSLLAVIGLVAGSVVLSAPAARAVPVLTPLSTDSFTGAATSTPNWKLVTASGSAKPCLTAGTNTTQVPIPGCAGTAIDPVGSGTLRLTNNAGGQSGTVYNTISIPTTAGIDVSFNSYQYNGSGADGIAFILAAANPDNPTAPSANGGVGGWLGYSGPSPAGGVSYGYLGFGLDVFGNFNASVTSGTGCSATSRVPQSVVVRGPGNGTAGYCVLAGQTTSGALDARASTTRPAAVPVQIALNPTTSATTTASGITVPASSWMIAWTGIGASRQTMTGALPTAARLNALGFPAGYYNPATGLPYQLTFGWAGATGGSTEIHEISGLSSTTLTSQLPSYRLAINDNQGGRFLTGGTATVSVSPSLDPDQGSESEAATVTTTFPAGLTPTNPTTAGYVCTTTGQVVSCRYTPETPLAAGTALPTLQIPVAVTAAAGTSPVITATVSSLDGNPQTASRTVTVASFVASATPGSTSYGTSTTLSGSGLPVSAGGTIVFRTGTTDLCTATLPAVSCSSPTGLDPATYPVTAAYSGDGTNPAVTATTSFTVVRATPTVSAAVGAASIAYGSTQTLTAAVSPAGASGVVTFRTTGGVVLCTIADIAVTTSCATGATLEPGSYPVTATYAGDSRFAGATSATTSFSVVRASAPFSAAATDPTVYGSPTSLSFSGLPASATGSVTFVSGGTTLCTVSDVTAASSCATAAVLPTDDYPVSAVYSGDSHYLSSTATTAFTVDPFPTELTAGVSDETIPFGTSTTLSFSGVPEGATGTVTYSSGGVTWCVIDVTLASSCASPADLAADDYAVTAVYSGDENHESSTDTTAFTVIPATVGTFTAGVSDPEPVFGSPVTLSFSGLPAGATGTVVFRSGGTVLCSIADVTTAGSCTTTATLGAGAYSVVADYSGDRNHAAATATTGFTVARIATEITATVSADVTAYGSPVSLTFAGLPAGATGTVTLAGTGVDCTVDLPGSTECLSAADLPVGSYSVTVTYSGDDNHLGSTTGVDFDVIPVLSPEFAAAASPATTPFGTPTALSFLGLVSGATGSVTFTAGGETLCTIADVTTTTSCAPDAGLPVGSYQVSVAYSGDANRAAATARADFDVVRAAVTPVVSIGLSTVTFGNSSTLGVTGLPAGATGSVTFTTGAVTLCTVADITVATSCPSPSGVPAGTYPVVATYSGDGSYTGGGSLPVTLTVVPAPSAVTVLVANPSPTYGVGTTVSLGNLPPGATGSATFTAGSLTLCTIADVSVQSSCAVPADLTAGPYAVTGVWSGDANHVGSTGGSQFTVTRAPTTPTVTVADLTFGADAVPVIGGLPAGTVGTVTLSAGDQVLCVRDLATGQGCTTITGLAAGSYAVTAVYSGDANHLPASTSTSFTVAPQSSEIGVTIDDLVYGQVPTPVVTGVPVGATGTITLSADGEVACTFDVATGPDCAEAFAGIEPGEYTFTVTYSGDANHLASESTVMFTVTPQPTTVSIAVPSVSFGGRIVPTLAGLPEDATGSVTYTVDGAVVCVLDLDTGDGCEHFVARTVGELTLVATYSGDDRYLPTTASTTFTVTRAATVVTGTPGGSVVVGTTTRLFVGDLPADATGTVTFVADGVTLCTVTLPATSCETTADLPPGVYDLQVLYSGDTVYSPTTSTTTLTVLAAEATTTPAPAPAPVPGTQVIDLSPGVPAPLAYTGTSATGWVPLSLLLLVAGGVLLVVGRRRRVTEHS